MHDVGFLIYMYMTGAGCAQFLIRFTQDNHATQAKKKKIQC